MESYLENLLNKIVTLFVRDWKLILILSTIFAFYYYATATFDFFKKKGVPYMKPVILFGNMGARIKATQSFHEYQDYIYNYFKGNPFGGFFEGRRPILYILDPDLIKSITTRDFDHFVDRFSLNLNQPRFLQQSLLNLKGSEWKAVRSMMTPVFSSARLRSMLPLVENCSKQMLEYFEQYDQKEVELKSAMGHYTLDVIGACAFGIQCKALSDKNSHFNQLAEKFDYIPRYKRITGLLILIFMPMLMKIIKLSFLNLEVMSELVKILQATKAERRATDSKNSDFLQILIDVAKKEQSDTDKNVKKYLDEDTIDAQCLLFLIAGYETSSTLLSFTCYELAKHPEIQEKLRAHILEATEGKEITYELLSQLDYLDGVLLETLRRYPPVARIDRVVTKPYTLPGTKVKLDVGDIVGIPIYGIHMDPEYYPEPQEFRPERFMGEEKKARPSQLFLAFGAGPRNCIGLRFAMVSVKIVMVLLMKNLKFTRCTKTEDPVSFHKRAVLLKPESGLWVRIEKL